MTTENLFFGGVPTEPDVRALRDAFPDSKMAHGDLITHAQVEATIGTSRASSRYRTVTTRWRKAVERETGRVILGPEKGVGFRVLDNTQKIDLGYLKFTSAVRSARRAHVITARLDAGATEDDKARALQLQRRTAAVIASAQIRSASDLPKLEN
jgi:hypothetical protein